MFQKIWKNIWVCILNPLIKQCAFDLGNSHFRNLYGSSTPKPLSGHLLHFNHTFPMHQLPPLYQLIYSFHDFYPHWMDENTEGQRSGAICSGNPQQGVCVCVSLILSLVLYWGPRGCLWIWELRAQSWNENQHLGDHPCGVSRSCGQQDKQGSYCQPRCSEQGALAIRPSIGAANTNKRWGTQRFRRNIPFMVSGLTVWRQSPCSDFAIYLLGNKK